ncbi:hypothetical protein [Wolbachia pipientis]|uniref:Uncharacterized protein n=1 Tax=Wolbachia pipientis TaxID=955 RepID=A0A7G5CDM8_WOLPI|nr:hypothetical protein [Wolbachia pipientis]QMV47312.1 hypothetical protein HC356_04860 [Wolbachia pipientis]
MIENLLTTEFFPPFFVIQEPYYVIPVPRHWDLFFFWMPVSRTGMTRKERWNDNVKCLLLSSK